MTFFKSPEIHVFCKIRWIFEIRHHLKIFWKTTHFGLKNIGKQLILVLNLIRKTTDWRIFYVL